MNIPKKHRRLVMLGSFIQPIFVIHLLVIFIGFPYDGQYPGTLYLFLFLLLIPLGLFAFFSCIFLMMMYVRMVAREKDIPEKEKALWIVFLVFLPTAGIPVFWYVFLKDLAKDDPDYVRIPTADDFDIPDGRESPFGSK